ncbi:hypothetical protein LXA43DRAFT_1088365 [Ganoderma leucocontextum]|nr:hypothetical protein LXA43DRAFT_1088365 [Ganoderma leucocontextum]
MSEVALPPGVSLHNTLGAAFVGNIVAAALYGLTTLQTYTYYGRSANDPKMLKYLIGVLWIFDTLHVVLISHTVYVYAVTGFGQVLALFSPTWSVLVAIILTGTSDALVRAIWVLSGRNWFFCGAVTASSLVVLACSIAYPIKSWQAFHSFIELENISWLLYLGLASVAIADSLISAALCWLLTRKRSVFKRVENMIRILVLWSVNTSALTTFCSLMSLIMYAAFPHTMIYIAFYFLLPKLLLNSLLGTLNARRSLRDNISGDMVTIPLSSITTGNREITITGHSHSMSDLEDGVQYPKQEDDDINPVQHAF